jgi:hypothetical protein
MRKNPFKNFLDKKETKDILIYGMSDILKPIYEPLDRWKVKDKPIITKTGYELWLHGVYDLNETTGEYDVWSGINFLNTNYSMLNEVYELLEEDGVVIEFNTEDVYDSKQKLRLFLKEIEKRKETILYDGTIKQRLMSIHKGTWKRGMEHSENVKSNYKKYWPNAIDITDDGSEKGLVRDMIYGIDAILHYEDNEDETIQTKGCKKIQKIGGEYRVECVVDYSKYKDITYFCFYPSNENKVYIFKNNENMVKNVTENDEPVFVLNEELIYFEGAK